MAHHVYLGFFYTQPHTEHIAQKHPCLSRYISQRVCNKQQISMSGDNPRETVTTEAEFEAALTALVTAAHENGVSVNKPWLCRTDDGLPDWETTIIELDGTATED